MKLPRWLVIFMLTTSALSVPAAAGWWWAIKSAVRSQYRTDSAEDNQVKGNGL